LVLRCDFEGDDQENRVNLQEHNTSFEVAALVFKIFVRRSAKIESLMASSDGTPSKHGDRCGLMHRNARAGSLHEGGNPGKRGVVAPST
jgi:hypothetical protein